MFPEGYTLDKYLYNYIIKDSKNGYYIDVSVYDGNLYNFTKFFNKYLGWKGILICFDETHKYKIFNRTNPFNAGPGSSVQ